MRKFFEACKPDTGLSATAVPVRWSRPLESFNKVNFDATMFENLGCAGIEVAIQHSDGEIIAALSQRIPFPHSVEMVEAMAARKTIVFAQEMSLSKVVVRGGVRNFCLGGPSCNTNIFIKTTPYTHINTHVFFIIYTHFFI